VCCLFSEYRCCSGVVPIRQSFLTNLNSCPAISMKNEDIYRYLNKFIYMPTILVCLHLYWIILALSRNGDGLLFQYIGFLNLTELVCSGHLSSVAAKRGIKKGACAPDGTFQWRHFNEDKKFRPVLCVRSFKMLYSSRYPSTRGIL